MGVSIFEGQKAERMVAALETLAEEANNSRTAAEAAATAQQAAATAQAAIATIQSLSEDLETIQQIAESVDPDSLGVVSFDKDQDLTSEEQQQARENIGLGDINSLVTGTVKYNADQTEDLTAAQQAQARANIGAAGSSELSNLSTTVSGIEGMLGTLSGGAVRFDTDQTLDSTQKGRALTNIGAASASDLTAATGRISTVEGQLSDVNSLVSGVVKYDTDQTTGNDALTDPQKAQARTNIGAASQADLTTANGNITTVTGAVGAIQTKLSNGEIVTDVSSDGGMLVVTYSNNDSDTIEVGAGIASVEYDSSYYLHFYDANGQEMFEGPFFIQGGGGGGGYSARITNHLGSSSLTVAENQLVLLPFTYTEYYGDENTGENGFMTVQYKRSTSNDWITLISNRQIGSGVRQEINVSNYIEEGTITNVRIVCTNGRSDEDAVTKTLQYNVICVAMSISTTFNATATYNGNISIPYSCIGRNLQKTVYLKIDDREYTHEDIGTSHNQERQLAVTMTGYNYGAHRAQMWFETPDGASSNVLEFVILYDNGTSDAPIVGARLAEYTIENGELLDIRYTCYTPEQESTDELTIKVFSVVDDQNVTHYENTFENIENNREFQLMLDQYPESGTGYVQFISGETSLYLQFTVTEIQTEYDITPVTSGLIYSYRPAGYTNNSAGRDTYVYSMTDQASNQRNIYTHMENFNWVTDGYLDGTSLTLTGSARMHIDLPILTTSFVNEDEDTVILDAASGATVTTSGRTVEFEFELSNVTDQNSTVFSCMDNNGVGFVITPQVCYLCSDGQSAEFDSTGFIENEESIPCAYIKDDKRIRVSFVIQRKRYSDEAEPRFISYANIFINGEYANSYLYNPDAIYNGSAGITIGSSDCTTKLYEIRMYNRDLNDSEILRNRMNSDADVRKRIQQNEYNDVLDSENRIDYNKAKYKYPCLLFIGPLSNFKADKKNVGVVLTKPDGLGSYTTEFSLLEKDQSNKFVSSIKVQGTSSQRFMRKNFKVALAKLDRDGNGDVKLDENDKYIVKKVKYVLKGYDENEQPLSIGESTLCFKMDYMSTDHANTFNGNIADTLFNDKPAGSLIQNTVWGFRCLLFNMPAESYVEGTAFEDYPEGTIEFAGDGCLNNDKGNSKSFGLEDPSDTMTQAEGLDTLQQKWEFKDNSQAPCSFKTDRLMEKVYSVGDNNVVTWTRAVKAALESCYPDEGDLEDEGLEPNYDHIQILFSWVCQRANFWDASTTYGTGGSYNGVTYTTERALKKAIFINEFPLHFNLEHALVYYLFIEWVALCDNRAKNMFLSCKNIRAENIIYTGGANSLADCINDETGEVDISKIDWLNSTFGIWYTDLYDLDSCFGAENSGYIRIPYYADWNYQLKGNYQFNGHDSRLWCMFEEAFATEIKQRAQEIVRTNTGYGALNYNVLKQVHITDNAELVCPAIVNEDMEYKYEDAWTEGFWDYSQDSDNPQWVQTSDYKYLQRGSRTEQKESFIFRRSNMLYSKYQCDPFLNDQLNFRCGTAVVKENSTITLSPVQAMWLGITYGDSGIPQMSTKKAAGESADIVSPNNLGRSDNVHIHGASNLTSVSSLAKFQPYEVGLTGARKLKTLLLGSDEQGYENSNLTSLNTSNCALLDTLNVQNCTGFSNTPINLTANPLIREVYAGGSTVPYFTFTNGGILETLELGTPTRIVLQNQQYLDDLTYDSLDNLTMLRIENTPNINSLEILQEALTSENSLRNGIRLIGIDETITDRDIFRLLTSSAVRGKRMDANGTLVNDSTAWPVITGTIHCPAIGANQKDLLEACYGTDLVIDAGEVLTQHSVTFVNQDGTPVKDRLGNNYIQYVDNGSTITDPILSGEIDTPTIEPDAQYTYTFSNWSNINGSVTGQRTVTAIYTSTTRTYTVRWYDYEGGTLLKTLTVNYGTDAKYDSTDDTVFPTRTADESFGRYYVFTGWDKSTGFVSEDLNVYGTWQSSGAPATRLIDPTNPSSGANPDFVPLNEMTVANIYAVTRSIDPNMYWEPEDYVDIRVGRDFNFSNVPSAQLADELFLNGSELITTNQYLFDEDKTFTLAIDYEFASDTNEATIMACYNGSGSEGLRLCYRSGYPTLVWGDQSKTIGNYGMKRGMLVILHLKGGKSLYIASNNVGQNGYNADIYENEILRTQTTITDRPIVFGGTASVNNSVAYAATGMIHWAKVWYGNLGSTAIRQLANWTHETWRMRYVNKNRYYPADGTGFPVAATFISNAALGNGYTMSPSTAAGWDETNLHTFMNSRCLRALPVEWQYIIKPVNLPVTKFDNSNTPTTTTVKSKMYIPSYADVNSAAQTSSYRYNHEGTTISWFTNNVSRFMFPGIILPEDHEVITLDEDPSRLVITYPNLKDGDVWVHTGRNNYAYVYVTAETAAKHGYIGFRPKNYSDYIHAYSGGLWVLLEDCWLRSRYYYYTSAYFYNITRYGTTTYSYYNNNLSIVPMFSI